MTTDQLLVIVGSLLSILITLLAYFGDGMNKQLSKIASSMNKIEKDLGVLTNDHYNLKDDVHDIKERVKILER